MSAGHSLPWAEAYVIAQEVSERLSPLVSRIKCVGSVRRRLDRVGDIEFLAEPHFDRDLLGELVPVIEPVREALKELGTWVKGGLRYMQITDLLGRSRLNLDVFLVHPPARWGSLLAIRTGPKELSQYAVTAMRGRGYRHEGGHAVRIQTGELVCTETEEAFFALAGVACEPPAQRDVQALELGSVRSREFSRPLTPSEVRR